MSIKIVADSSANLIALDGADFASVPLTVQAGEAFYRDDERLDVEGMLKELSAFKGKTSTACPAPGDWLEAFGDAEQVVGVSITSKLSGCYNSSQVAAKIYEQENPGRRVFILDGLTTGPELELLVEKIHELELKGLGFSAIRESLAAYSEHTGLVFLLSTLENFVKNGRVSAALARLVDILNIRIVGKASEVGDLEPLHKCRGDKGGLGQLWKSLKKEGYRGGKLRIRHTVQEKLAYELQRMALEEFPGADVTVDRNRGLCSYYAQEGGILVGFEK